MFVRKTNINDKYKLVMNYQSQINQYLVIVNVFLKKLKKRF